MFGVVQSLCLYVEVSCVYVVMVVLDRVGVVLVGLVVVLWYFCFVVCVGYVFSVVFIVCRFCSCVVSMWSCGIFFMSVFVVGDVVVFKFVMVLYVLFSCFRAGVGGGVVGFVGGGVVYFL